MITKIKYTSTPDNCSEVAKFIGSVPPCPTCNDYGEYESGYGPRACMPCCSRELAFINHENKRKYVDWGDTIERREDGLHLHKSTQGED